MVIITGVILIACQEAEDEEEEGEVAGIQGRVEKLYFDCLNLLSEFGKFSSHFHTVCQFNIFGRVLKIV